MAPQTVTKNGKHISLPANLSAAISMSELDAKVLEREMDKCTGWKLSELSLGKASREAKISRRYIRHYANSYPGDSFFTKRSEASFECHRTPTAMFFTDINQLSGCISTLYQLLYFHYVIGRHERMKGNFPRMCCGISARNAVVAAWDAGVVSAVSVYNSSRDHSYMMVPYVVGTTGEGGVILADPTSDQLYNDCDRKIRNDIRILPRDGWKYETDWKRGGDLYPEDVQISSCYGSSDRSYQEYINQALINPVVVI